MYHIYHTQGFVLESKNFGDADKIITLYTRELGLVRARAQGIRFEKSKSRFALQDLSLAEIDLVCGKEFWRITSTKSVNYFPFLKRDQKSIQIFYQISKLIIKLCAGEESNQNIFDSIIQTLHLLDKENLDLKYKESLELYLVFRIVYELGYVGDSNDIQEFLGNHFDESKLDLIFEKRISIISHINKAIEESHL